MGAADSKPRQGEEPVVENSENAGSRPLIAQSDNKAANYTANALDSSQAVFHGSGIQHTGQGHFSVQGNVNITSNSPSDSKEVKKCMKALFVTDPLEDRGMLKRKKGSRASGTCEWILHTKELNGWLQLEETEQKSQSNNILWLHGNPGTGKSTMAIFLTEKLSIDFDKVENMTIAYFFCDAGFDKQKTATSIIRGLLYQLVQQHEKLLSDYILPKYKERGNQLFTSFDAIWAVFVKAAADEGTGRKYCIIDALDECDNDSKEILLYQLHETFHCQRQAPNNLFILITSRPYPEIREYLQDFINTDLASFKEAGQDIARCIKEGVNDLAKKKNYTDKVKREITNLLREKAEGTFLWVGLACEELRRKPSKDATQFLRDMPKGLTSLYKNLLKTATEDGSSECVAIRRILSFVVVSFKALSVLELSEACQLHQDELDPDTRLQYTRDQIASCRLLAVIHDERVQLLHQSVRDFLTGSGSSFFVRRLEAHAGAASSCIDTLVKGLHHINPSESGLRCGVEHHLEYYSEDDEEDEPEYPFLEYAKAYWAEHVREAGGSFKIYEPQIPFFERDSNSMWRWIRRRIYGYLPEYAFLHAAVELGLPILVEYALGIREVHPITGGSAFNIKQELKLDESKLSPLNRALLPRKIDQKTQAEIVDILLKAGATVTPKDISIVVRTNWVDQKVVLTLLDHMNPETRTTHIQQLIWTEIGRESKFMPLILAKYGHQITIEEEFVRCVVSSSTGMGILRVLLDQRKISVTEKILERATGNVEQGSEFVRLLLEYQGHQILITDDIMTTAARNRKQGSELVEILLKHQGRQTWITDHLIIAAICNTQHGKRIIQLLCQHQGDTITITTEILRTAISQEKGGEFLELLFQHRGDQSTVTIDYITLWGAARNFSPMRTNLSFCFQKLGNSINFFDMVLTVMAKFYDEEELIEFIIQEGGPHITITDGIVGAVLDADWFEYEQRIVWMEIFFKHQQNLKFTGNALATIREFKATSNQREQRTKYPRMRRKILKQPANLETQ